MGNAVSADWRKRAYGDTIRHVGMCRYEITPAAAGVCPPIRNWAAVWVAGFPIARNLLVGETVSEPRQPGETDPEYLRRVGVFAVNFGPARLEDALQCLGAPVPESVGPRASDLHEFLLAARAVASAA